MKSIAHMIATIDVHSTAVEYSPKSGDVARNRRPMKQGVVGRFDLKTVDLRLGRTSPRATTRPPHLARHSDRNDAFSAIPQEYATIGRWRRRPMDAAAREACGMGWTRRARNWAAGQSGLSDTPPRR